MELLVRPLERCLDPLTQIPGGGGREGEREDVLGGHALVHQPGEPAHERVRLAGAGPGHDDERPVVMSDGRLLRAVQAVEDYGHRRLGYAAACRCRTAPTGSNSAAGRRTPRETPSRRTDRRRSARSRPGGARGATPPM